MWVPSVAFPSPCSWPKAKNPRGLGAEPPVSRSSLSRRIARYDSERPCCASRVNAPPFLRIARKPRRKPYGKPSRQGQILGKRSIDERPKEANERTRLGDWEGDTVVGKGRTGYLVTCVDRASRYVIARKVHACAAKPVAEQLQRTLRRLPAEKRRSLTLDNGREFARPMELERRLDLPIYFAHPYHSWERGTNENTNGLLRQYLPKGTDLTQVTPAQLRLHVAQLNHRPRKCLSYRSPFEIFHAQTPT